MLRQLADDVRDRFTRLRMRGGGTTTSDNVTSSSKPTAKKSTSAAAALPPSGKKSSSRHVTSRRRTETPDLIRPHVSTRTASSLPPLPTMKPEADMMSSVLRRSDQPPTYLGMHGTHVYEEIPTLDNRKQSANFGPELGRVFYISPIDGALCRIFPVDDVINRRQLVCPHVRCRPSAAGSSSTLFDVSLLNGEPSSVYVMRGRELRMCAICYDVLRQRLESDEIERDASRCRQPPAEAGPRPSFYNACDLGLIHIPCNQYFYGDDSYDFRFGGTTPVTTRSGAGASTLANKSTSPPTIISSGVVIHDRFAGDIPGDVSDVATGSVDGSNSTSGLRLGQTGSAFTKVVSRRSSLPVPGMRVVDGRRDGADLVTTSLTSVVDRDTTDTNSELRHRHDYHRHHRHPPSVRRRQHSLDSDDQELQGQFCRDERRRPLRDVDDVIAAQLSSTADVSTDESSYLSLCDDNSPRQVDNRVDELHDDVDGGSSSSGITTLTPPVVISDVTADMHQGPLGGLSTASGCDTGSKNRKYDPDGRQRSRRVSGDRCSTMHATGRSNVHQRQVSSNIIDTNSSLPAGSLDATAPDDDDFSRRRLSHRPVSKVRSVCYNGLLASMIDLSGCDSGLNDRLSCRATTGPRCLNLIRSSRQTADPEMEQQDEMDAQPQTCGGRRWTHGPQRRGHDQSLTAFHHSMGDLLLTSVR